MGVVKKWTPDEVKMLLELIDAGMYYHEIAERVGRSEGGIEAKARELGVQRMPKRIPKTTGTLCWRCKNATNSGCLWSRKFEEVPGWTAKKDSLKSGGKDLTTYTVYECPQFEEG